MESLAAVAANFGTDGSRASMPELAALFENPGDETPARDLAHALQTHADGDEAFRERLVRWRGQPEIQALERHLTRIALLSAGTSHVAESADSAAEVKQDTSPQRRRWKSFWSSAWTITILGGAGASLIIWAATQAFSAGHPPPESQTSASASALKARAEWCCQLAAAEGSAGYIWSNSYENLQASVKAGSLNLTRATHAGIGQIEISLQTESTEPIYVAPPEVVVLGRARRPSPGLLVVEDYTPQGTGAASQFTADLDEPDPVTVPDNPESAPASAGSPAINYFYVSQNSPEIMILRVVDHDFLCHFSILLKWRIGGRNYQHLFVNDGQEFTIAGSIGLRNVEYNPIVGTLKASPSPAR